MFARFKMSPPRGVLLYGAPGTGKTLLARALAASCSRAGAEVTFFMRKGADVLSKWVGESERQLRLLFEVAQKMWGEEGGISIPPCCTIVASAETPNPEP